MKAPLKPRSVSSRPAPEEVLRLATEAAPRQPPAITPAPERSTTLNLRVRQGTVDGLTEAAKARGLTMKQVVAQALQAAGVIVDSADLEDRTPRRKGVKT